MKGLINMGSALAFAAMGMIMLDSTDLWDVFVPLYIVVLASHAAGAMLEKVLESPAVRKD